MSKSNEKIHRTYDAKRAEAIKWTARKFSVTEQYVRRLDNDASLTTGRSEEIRKAFREKYEQLQKLLS